MMDISTRVPGSSPGLHEIHQVIDQYKAIENPRRTESVGIHRYFFTSTTDDFLMVIDALRDTSRRVWSIIERDGKLHIGWGYHPEHAVGHLITALPCPTTESCATDFTFF